jgi:tRNA G46 methylase TrmB
VTSARSIYAHKLLEFPDVALVDQAAFQHRGRWSDFFRQRIGPTFNGRVVFEIGCSDAAYLARLAAKHPHTAFVGLDWKYKALYDGAQRIAGLDIRNVALLRGRGQDVSKIFAEREIDEVWVFHPDPCDRPVELKTRLIAEPFLTDLHPVLRDYTSTLCLKTDHPGYYQWVLGLFGLPQPDWFLVQSRDLMRAQDIPKPNEAVRRRFNVTAYSANFWNDPDALAHTSDRLFAEETTAFESRFIRKRRPIYYFEISKA